MSDKLFHNFGLRADTPKDAVGDPQHRCDKCGWPMHLLSRFWECGLCSGALDNYKVENRPEVWYDVTRWKEHFKGYPQVVCDCGYDVKYQPCPNRSCDYGLKEGEVGIEIPEFTVTKRYVAEGGVWTYHSDAPLSRAVAKFGDDDVTPTWTPTPNFYYDPDSVP